MSFIRRARRITELLSPTGVARAVVGIDDAHVAADAALIDSSVDDWYAVSQRPFVDLVLHVLAVHAGDDQVNSLKCAKVIFNLPMRGW